MNTGDIIALGLLGYALISTKGAVKSATASAEYEPSGAMFDTGEVGDVVKPSVTLDSGITISPTGDYGLGSDYAQIVADVVQVTEDGAPLWLRQQAKQALESIQADIGVSKLTHVRFQNQIFTRAEFENMKPSLLEYAKANGLKLTATRGADGIKEWSFTK